MTESFFPGSYQKLSLVVDTMFIQLLLYSRQMSENKMTLELIPSWWIEFKNDLITHHKTKVFALQARRSLNKKT